MKSREATAEKLLVKCRFAVNRIINTMKVIVACLGLSLASAFAQVPRAPATAGAATATPKKPQPDLLSLKPTIVQYESDGLILPRISFTGSKSRVLFPEPNGFKLSEEAATFTLVSKAERTAIVQCVNSATMVLPLDTAERRKAIRETILATAPKDAARVEMVSESENPFPINGWTTFQFTMSYGLFGQTFKKQVVFVRLHQFQELQFIAHAPEKYFGNCAGAVGTILKNWYQEPLDASAATPKTKAVGE